jgi:hypothetical protein
MRRRNFVMSVLASGVGAPALAAQQPEHKGGSGPPAKTTVSLGEWNSAFSPPLDRFVATPNTSNMHMVLPFESQIKAGGAVNFVISGFHVLGIYGPGTEFEDVNGSIRTNIPGAPMGFPQAVDDSVNRVYRGLSPWQLSPAPLVDRVESVNFPNPGRYLVVCVFVPHFLERMHGYVNVLP